MTRTATAPAWAYFEMETPRDNVVDFCSYRSQQVMESRHYVLVPVETPVASTYTPRPRRNHHNAVAANIIHTALNLSVVGVTILFTSLLVGMI